MRPIIIHVPDGEGKEVLELAGEFDGKNLSIVKGRDAEKGIDIISIYLSNNKVEGFISKVTKIDKAGITLFPRGVMALYPPVDKAPEQVTSVELRSPVEIFLSALQSKGSWKTFIGYSVITSIVVWIGLYTNTSFLLVAAMLIAPFAGPAMNTAIASSRGDIKLLKQGLKRYFLSIIITISGVAALSFAFQQEIATSLMIERSQVSSVAVLLALAAGAAGAVNLIQSDRDSLVSGAAAGMLVAASLAPPAGVTGMAIAMGRWEMVKSGIFLLFLQLFGINLAGSLVFRFAGLNSKGARYTRGKKSVFIITMVLTIVLLLAAIFWQFHKQPDLQKSSIAQRAEAIIQKEIRAYPEIELVEINARFTSPGTRKQNTLLCEIFVQKTNTSSEVLVKEMKKAISSQINSKYKAVKPLVEIIVLEKYESE